MDALLSKAFTKDESPIPVRVLARDAAAQ